MFIEKGEISLSCLLSKWDESKKIKYQRMIWNKIEKEMFDYSFLIKTGLYFCTCEDGAGWHLIPYIISPRSEFFSQAYKTWHITWGINLGPDWPPLARGSKFHTIHTPTRPLSLLPLDNGRYGPIGFSLNNIIL